MSATRPSFTRSLGADLERDRLERRVTRVTVAIAALRDRASEHRPGLGGPLDELLEGCVSGREECQAVALAYGRLIAPGCSERRLVYAAYFAARDREEHAARIYAHHVERVRRIFT